MGISARKSPLFCRWLVDLLKMYLLRVYLLRVYLLRMYLLRMYLLRMYLFAGYKEIFENFKNIEKFS